MRPRRPRARPEADDVPALPPLDGEDDEPRADDGDDRHEIESDDSQASLDDAAAEDLADDSDVGNGEAETGWADGADDADDADVGDLAEGIDVDDASSWLGDDGDGPPSVDEADLDNGDAESGDDDADGPAGDEDFVLESGDLVRDDEPGDDAEVDPLGAGETTFAPLDEPAAFRLPAAPEPAHAVVHTDGTILAAVARSSRIVLAGDGVYSVSLPATAALNAQPISTRNALPPGRELLTALAPVGPRAFLAATRDGAVLHSDDGGTHWERVGALGSDGGGDAGVELLADGTGNAARVWARAHGGLFRSDDAGRHWDGPLLDGPVRALCSEPGGGVLVVGGAAGSSPSVFRSNESGKLVPLSLALPRGAAPTLVASRGGVVVVAFSRGPGAVFLPDGVAGEWPLLEGATAVLVAQTDDGAPQIVAAVHDDAGGHATLVSAAVAPDASARHPRRFADLENLFPQTIGDESDDAFVESLVALDAGARRVLVLTPRGVLVVARPGGAPARPGPTGTDD